MVPHGRRGPGRSVAELNGVRLVIREFGTPGGRPLLFLHGWPGSGAQAVLLDSAAKKHGFRVLAPDRPGIGESPCQPGRHLLDWPPLVRDLASEFGFSRIAIIGVSGGGPYALACAWALPGLAHAVSVVCGAPPIAGLPHGRGLHPGYRFLLGLFRRRPRLVHRLFSRARPLMLWQDAPKFLAPLRMLLARPDAESLDNPRNFDAVFQCQRDAFGNIDGLFADAALYAAPWGFEPEEIRTPVQFWHGREDRNFHFSLAGQLAARVPSATFRVVENEGHFSLPIRQADAILAALVETC